METTGKPWGNQTRALSPPRRVCLLPVYFVACILRPQRLAPRLPGLWEEVPEPHQSGRCPGDGGGCELNNHQQPSVDVIRCWASITRTGSRVAPSKKVFMYNEKNKIDAVLIYLIPSYHYFESSIILVASSSCASAHM